MAKAKGEEVRVFYWAPEGEAPAVYSIEIGRGSEKPDAESVAADRFVLPLEQEGGEVASGEALRAIFELFKRLTGDDAKAKLAMETVAEAFWTAALAYVDSGKRAKIEKKKRQK
jgi:hypothetical protein